MKSKGRNTNIVAFITLLLGSVVVGAWLFDKIDNEKLTLGIATIGILSATVTARLSKDQGASHTKDN